MTHYRILCHVGNFEPFDTVRVIAEDGPRVLIAKDSAEFGIVEAWVEREYVEEVGVPAPEGSPAIRGYIAEFRSPHSNRPVYAREGMTKRKPGESIVFDLNAAAYRATPAAALSYATRWVGAPFVPVRVFALFKDGTTQDVFVAPKTT